MLKRLLPMSSAKPWHRLPREVVQVSIVQDTTEFQLVQAHSRPCSEPTEQTGIFSKYKVPRSAGKILKIKSVRAILATNYK